MRYNKVIKNSIRWRKSSSSKSSRKKAEATNRNQAKIKNEETQALNTLEINALLKKADNFIGTFSCDNLKSLVLRSFPVCLVVNSAPSNMHFGHWLALRIDENSLEIFDSFGGKPQKWGKNSQPLLRFLQFYSRGKTLYISPVLQTSLSQLCGYFAVYFILARKYLGFRETLKPFSKNLQLNNMIILDLLDSVL